MTDDELKSKRLELWRYPISHRGHPTIKPGDECLHPSLGEGVILSTEKGADKWGANSILIHLWFAGPKKYIQTSAKHFNNLTMVNRNDR